MKTHTQNVGTNHEKLNFSIFFLKKFTRARMTIPITVKIPVRVMIVVTLKLIKLIGGLIRSDIEKKTVFNKALVIQK